MEKEKRKEERGKRPSKGRRNDLDGEKRKVALRIVEGGGREGEEGTEEREKHSEKIELK